MTDDEEDFGGALDAPIAEPSNIVPFPKLRSNRKLDEAWKAERKPYLFQSPLDALAEVKRLRAMPVMPWPADWPELAKRCRLHVGQCIGITGPTGGGKTSFAIQICRAVAGEGSPVLWLCRELSPPEIDYRIVANMAGVHTAALDAWSMDELARQLSSITDAWRFVDYIDDPDAQVEASRAAIRAAKKIHRMPPLLVIDYLGKFASAAPDPKAATRKYAEAYRKMALEEECWIALLNQPSRANTAKLTGREEVKSAADAIAVASDSSEIEHACAVVLGLAVFKADDAMELDAHWLVSKARNTGREGREGARFLKPGGVWRELGYLPGTPLEVDAEIARAKKDKSRVEQPTPTAVRTEVNAIRATDADATRRAQILVEITRRGPGGMTLAEIRNLRGAGRGVHVAAALQELERRGDIVKLAPLRWRAQPRGG